MAVQVINRWCAPLMVDFGSPIGRVRVPKVGETVLDVEFNDLQLPPKAAAMVGKGTLTITDMDLPAEEKPKSDPEPAPPDATTTVVDTPDPAPKPEAAPAMPADRVAELRTLAAGDKRSPTTRKAIELLDAAGISVEP